MNLLFAPHDRLSPFWSYAVVDGLLGVGLILAAAFLLWRARCSWLQARRLAADVWHHPALRPGPVLLSGSAHRAEQATAWGALVVLTVTQQGAERGERDPYVEWTETSRELDGHPFLFRSDGHEVLVRPVAIDLIDRLEETHYISPALRTRTARITEGEPLWIKGTLRSELSNAVAGPYRGADTRWVLEAPPSGRLVVSSKPVGADLRRAAILRIAGAFALLGLMSFYQLVVFHEVRELRARGVATQATIQGQRHWVTHSKAGDTPHFAWTVAYDTSGGNRGKQIATAETSHGAWDTYALGKQVPVVYSPSEPSVMQIGPASEVGASTFSLWMTAAAAMLIWFFVMWRQDVSRKLKWSRRETLVERVPGKLKDEIAQAGAPGLARGQPTSARCLETTPRRVSTHLLSRA